MYPIAYDDRRQTRREFVQAAAAVGAASRGTRRSRLRLIIDEARQRRARNSRRANRSQHRRPRGR